jgi:predicted DNA-binding transcriptional regulator AlpA|tara:strand:- start:886 stop:1137 length:252 start_codon:yes stop_codon:yes gene_type:complete
MTKIEINGTIYNTYKEAAEATGWSMTMIWRHMQEGRIGALGTGRTTPRRVEINGVKYKSIREASRALNITFETLRRKLSKGEI